MRQHWPALALILAGCTAAAGWSKPGADQSATARDYQDCRDIAASAVKPEIGIDEDILASRQGDWQRSRVGEVASNTMHDQTRDRGAAITASCMRAKGYAAGR